MRYAVYFCPSSESSLAQFGQQWLSTRSIPGITEQRFDELLKDVRRYGWHGTLSAPCELAETIDFDILYRQVADIAGSTMPFKLPLHIARLGGFLSLRPAASEVDINALAERCTRELNPLRAPLSEAMRNRRAIGLDATARALLDEFGYPYVLDRFRFHMTLCAAANVAEEEALLRYLTPRLEDDAQALVDALTICCEKEPGATFDIVAVIALGREADR